MTIVLPKPAYYSHIVIKVPIMPHKKICLHNMYYAQNDAIQTPFMLKIANL